MQNFAPGSDGGVSASVSAVGLAKVASSMICSCIGRLTHMARHRTGGQERKLLRGRGGGAGSGGARGKVEMDQLGQRPGAGLLHQRGAMVFDRARIDAEPIGYFLVGRCSTSNSTT